VSDLIKFSCPEHRWRWFSHRSATWNSMVRNWQTMLGGFNRIHRCCCVIFSSDKVSTHVIFASCYPPTSIKLVCSWLKSCNSGRTWAFAQNSLVSMDLLLDCIFTVLIFSCYSWYLVLLPPSGCSVLLVAYLHTNKRLDQVLKFSSGLLFLIKSELFYL